MFNYFKKSLNNKYSLPGQGGYLYNKKDIWGIRGNFTPLNIILG